MEPAQPLHPLCIHSSEVPEPQRGPKWTPRRLSGDAENSLKKRNTEQESGFSMLYLLGGEKSRFHLFWKADNPLGVWARRARVLQQKGSNSFPSPDYEVLLMAPHAVNSEENGREAESSVIGKKAASCVVGRRRQGEKTGFTDVLAIWDAAL